METTSTTVRNVHTRRLGASIERVRPWIEACWSGGDGDPFPRDVLPTWRKNPDGVEASALLPGVTVLGHGPFGFRLRSWDGFAWRVDVQRGPRGWHGFDLRPDGDGCTITHTLELIDDWEGRAVWTAIHPIHDWAVEALFDRMERALETGRVPATTERPMGRTSAAALAGLRALFWIKRAARTRRSQSPDHPRAAVS
ncbi:MAG: hypothetical protein U0414_44395 [Polyangiaceae bacterium]